MRRRILEIGCGSAPFLYSALGRGYDAQGIDVDYERIRIAELKVDAFGLPDAYRGRARIGDATALEFATASFDLVTSWAVIEHIPVSSRALRERLRAAARRVRRLHRPRRSWRLRSAPEIPWPPMAPRSVCDRWVTAMDRPPGGIGTFFPITDPRVAAALESLGCRIVTAELTLPIDHETTRLLDVSDQATLERTAETIEGMAARGILPPSLRGTTVFHVAAQKL
ncbi:MAG: hypothetical protein NVS3B7_09670 [Candidatus Elarobacter sp.]